MVGRLLRPFARWRWRIEPGWATFEPGMGWHAPGSLRSRGACSLTPDGDRGHWPPGAGIRYSSLGAQTARAAFPPRRAWCPRHSVGSAAPSSGSGAWPHGHHAVGAIRVAAWSIGDLPPVARPGCWWPSRRGAWSHFPQRRAQTALCLRMMMARHARTLVDFYADAPGRSLDRRYGALLIQSLLSGSAPRCGRAARPERTPSGDLQSSTGVSRASRPSRSRARKRRTP